MQSIATDLPSIIHDDDDDLDSCTKVSVKPHI